MSGMCKHMYMLSWLIQSCRLPDSNPTNQLRNLAILTLASSQMSVSLATGLSSGPGSLLSMEASRPLARTRSSGASETKPESTLPLLSLTWASLLSVGGKSPSVLMPFSSSMTTSRELTFALLVAASPSPGAGSGVSTILTAAGPTTGVCASGVASLELLLRSSKLSEV